MIFWWKYKPAYSAVLYHTSSNRSNNFSATVVFLENSFGNRKLRIDGLDSTRPTQRINIKRHPWYLAFAKPWDLGTLTLDDVRNGRSDDLYLFPDGKVTRKAGGVV